jgi:N-acetylglucosaminyldiphosphoundecaprenol N-acetyl-beta-D-mannosaminyltransferase
MAENTARSPGSVLIGVGVAFDYLAGDVRRAPPWMRNNGLEWLHRLFTDPTRLWRRYLLLAPMFVAIATWETLRARRR